MSRCVALALAFGGIACFAQPPEELDGDGALRVLVQEALEAKPELAELVAQTRAAQERVPQAGAWPEPMLQVGVQNDSFNRWQVGTMETSWVSFMASQTFPFPGKVGLREAVARADVRLTELQVDRMRLSTIAEVRRGYLALQLVRERKSLLEQLVALSKRLVEVARIRLESGAGAQSEVLRAQVELSRVNQRRYLLEAEERLETEALNRLRRHPLDKQIETTSRLSTTPMPSLLSQEAFLELARQHSPELLRAQTAVNRADGSVSLAQRSYFPDLSVSAGVMLRGKLEPMWALTVGVPLPVFAGTRQSRAVNEAEAQSQAAGSGVAVVEQLLALRAHQRVEAMKALQAVFRNYQEGLLVQAAAAAESTMTQYIAGRATFAAVLEANAVFIAETESSIQILAGAWRLVIAQDELTLAAGDSASPVPQGSGTVTTTSSPAGM